MENERVGDPNSKKKKKRTLRRRQEEAWKKPRKLAIGVRTTSVLFVECMKQGLLAKMIRQEEPRLADITGFRIKTVENGGTSLANMFSTSLKDGKICGRSDCPTCWQEDEQHIDCFQRNLVYESYCTICAPEADGRSSRRMETLRLDTPGVYVG